MVLVRFDEKKLSDITGVTEERLLKVPWLLGGEARREEGEIVMEFNPDRPDLYSIQGVSRAIRTYEGLEHFTTQNIREEKVEAEPVEEEEEESEAGVA